MSIALSGPHRCGKTTLAKLYAKRTGMPFLETKSSAVFERLGYSPKVDYDFRTRLMIQREILRDANSLYMAAKEPFITDRSPIDFLSYTLADVTRDNVNGELVDELALYIDECFEVLNRNFNIIMIIQPGIKLVDAEGKAPINKAYIEHLHNLVLGLTINDRVKCNHFLIPKAMTDLEERFNVLDTVVLKVNTKHANEMGNARVH